MAVRSEQPTNYRVQGALSKHAKTVLRVPGQPAGHAGLASAVLNVPDGWAYRFGIAALTEPVFDAIDSVNEITDAQLQGAVQELWGLFAVEFAQAEQAP